MHDLEVSVTHFGIKFCRHLDVIIELKENPLVNSESACVVVFVCIFLSLFFSLKLISLWTFEAFRTMNLSRSQKKAIFALWDTWHWLKWLCIDQNIKMRDASVRQHVTAVTNRALVEKSHRCPLNWPGLKSVAVWRIVFSHHYFSLTLWQQQRERAPGYSWKFWTVIAGCHLQLKTELFSCSSPSPGLFLLFSLSSQKFPAPPRNFMIKQSRIA